jgi:hypothetical protein
MQRISAGLPGSRHGAKLLAPILALPLAGDDDPPQPVATTSSRGQRPPCNHAASGRMRRQFQGLTSNPFADGWGTGPSTAPARIPLKLQLN